jgi:hypothetical protein
MRAPIPFVIVAVSIGLTFESFAQDPTNYGSTHAVGITPPGTASTTTGIGTTSKSTSGTAPSTTPDEGPSDENDDTLYHGKTSESLGGAGLRDEGPLHFKTRPKEKIQEVDSLKNLQSSGSDPKFQGSLLNSSVSSIEKVSEKAKETRDPADEGDPRFKTKRLVFTPNQDDRPKKAQSDSSPSPTPSPTASPSTKNSGGTKP